jgi:hypothetical protein
MGLWTFKRAWFAALAACTCIGIAGSASAQCVDYTVTTGAVAYQNGTVDSGNHADDSSTAITTPFAITFYGTTYPSGSTVKVCSNGFLQFSGTATSFTNATALPSTAVPGAAIFVYWDDLNTTTTNNAAFGIRTAVIGAAPSRQWVIDWKVGLGTSGTTLSSQFNIVFYEGSNDFDLVYGPVLNGAAAVYTVGIQSNSTTGSAVKLLGANAANTVAANTSKHFACAAPSGSCCSTAGVCSLVASAAACVSPSTYNVGNFCTPNVCVGACCSTTGGCTSTIATGCVSPSTFTTLGSACTPNPCGGACCNTVSGVCTSSTAALCTGANTFFNGNGSVCSPNPCTGACCNNSTAACTLTVAASCTTGSTFNALGSVCSPTPCPSGGCCSTISGICSVTGPAGCTPNPAPRTYLGTGVACTTVNCVVPGAPANDACAFPEPAGFDFSGTAFSVVGQNKTATTDGSAGSPATPPNANPCGVGSAIGTGPSVYYTFTPTVTNNYSVALCFPANNWDSVVSVHTACPPSSANALACNDDGACAGGIGLSLIDKVSLTGGITYLIRVAGYSGTTSNDFILAVSSDPIGGCCKNDGTCAPFTQANCALQPGGIYLGDGVSCNGAVCTGACCDNATAACTSTGSAGCAGGVYQGRATVCSPTPCVGGACCNPDTTCTFTGPTGCSSPNTYQGNGSTCTAIACPGQVCCNNSTGACTVLPLGNACPAGNTSSAATTCAAAACPISACCDPASGACTLTGSNACPSGTNPNAATSCTTTTCPAPPPPSNDECSAAIALIVNDPPTSGATTFATGTAVTCSSTTADVWYSVHASVTTTHRVLAVSTAGVAVSVFAASPCPVVSGATIVCGFNPTTSIDWSATAGSDYLVRIGGYTGTVDPFTVQVVTVASGACCNASTAACTISTTGTAGCAAGATYLGDTTVCDQTSCPSSTCCNDSTGACTLTGTAGCATGTTANAGTTCATTVCPTSTCCDAATGVCTVTGTAPCASGLNPNAATACTTNPCPQPPPPANDDCGNAIALTLGVAYQGANTTATDGIDLIPTCQTLSHKGVWFTFTAPATTNYKITTCGTNFDTVLAVYSGADCSTLTQVGCDDDSCVGDGTDSPLPGPAGNGSGLASLISSQAMTAGQTYRILVSAYGSAPAGGAYGVEVVYTNAALVGSCCVGASCSLTEAAGCTGTFTAGGVCLPSPCVQPGVCCRGSTCNTTFVDAAACAAAVDTVTATVVSKFVPATAACNTPVTIPGTLGNTTSPCCYANYNHNATLEVQDIFDFLNDWFAGKKAAIVGGNGTTGTLEVQNIFDFLNAWFAGGCS